MTRASGQPAVFKRNRKPRDYSEHRLQKAVVQFMKRAAKPGAFCFACPNGMVSDHVSVARMKDAGLFPGVADLVVVLPSREVAFLELKTPTGRLQPSQKDFKSLCARYDIKYAIARTIDEAIEVLVKWGALQPRLRWPSAEISIEPVGGAG